MKQIPIISIEIDIIIAVIKRKRGNMENWGEISGGKNVSEVESRTPHSHINFSIRLFKCQYFFIVKT